MSKKLRLSSFVSKVSYGGITLTSFEIRSLPIKDLFCPCDTVPGYSAQISKSIKKNGLYNPIIVVRVPTEDYLAHCKENNFRTSNIPDRPALNVVWGGNNRVEAAKNLGFDAIDCVMMPTFELAMKVQSIHRKNYPRENEALAQKS